MQAIPDIRPLFAWDGGARLAFAVSPVNTGTLASIIAHGPETSSCIAIWEAAAGLCVANLPSRTQHLDLTIDSGTGESRAFAVELDAQLLPAMVDLRQDGLSPVRLDTTTRNLSLEAEMPRDGLVALNLLAQGGAGQRIKVGPLIDAAADTTVTSITLTPMDGTAEVVFQRPGGASPVLVVEIPAATEALRSMPPDLTGVEGTEAVARGFRLGPVTTARADAGHHNWTGTHPGDRLLLLAPRSHRIRFGEAGQPGTRLLLTITGDGAISAEITTHAYRPATSTALAALGGRGNALAAADGGKTEADVVDRAAALAEAWWKRERQGGLSASRWLEDLPAAPASSYPFARLTLAATQYVDAGVSPLTAAMGAALALPPALVEEIEALPATDRAALARWTALAPGMAGDAVRARISLTDADPAAGSTLGTAITRAADQGFPAEMAELAERLAPRAASAERRQEIALIQSFADRDRAIWMSSGDLAEVLAIQSRNPAPTPVLSPAARLIADIKRDQTVWSVAQREAATADLGLIAERRAMIPIAAVGAGISDDAAADIEGRLPALTSAEIILLHRHLTIAAQRQALVRAVKLAVMALDDAAGSRGLAARMDRSGDPLVGMTRIGSAAESVVRELIAMPQARDALVHLTNWINACLPPVEAGHALSEQLVRNLKSYGCFLLMHAIAAECRTQLDGSGESAAAFVKRLNSGLAETLPRFAAAASARAADDLRLGLAFTGRLPVLHGKAAA